MRLKQFRYALCAGLLVLGLSACEQTASLDAPGRDYGVAKVKDFQIENNVRVALFKQSEVTEDKQPELTYGSMDAHFVSLEDAKEGKTIDYMVDWKDLQDFKNLKRGEEINFRATDHRARLEKNGKIYRVISLYEM